MVAVRDVVGSTTGRALLQLVPGGLGSAIDVYLTDGARMIQEERMRTFFDELGRGGVALTEALIADDDFLHCFFAAARAAARARRGDKVRLFARVLANGVVNKEAGSIDEFEEAVSILDGLSMREWSALVMFERRLEVAPPDESPLRRVAKFWPSFVDEVSATLGVARAEVSDFVHGTARAGLFARFVGFWDDDGRHGTTTPTFRRIERLVRERGEVPGARDDT